MTISTADRPAILDDVLADMAEIIEADERAKIAAAEREQCIKDVCYRCRDPQTYAPAVCDREKRTWRHPFSRGAIKCFASAIHERAAREE